MFSRRIADSPVGSLDLWATREGVRHIGFHRGVDLIASGEALSGDDPPPHLGRAAEQLTAYFEGRLRDFEIELDFGSLTSFQVKVYERLRRIPYGRVTTYGQIAHDIGEGPQAARAVGRAVGANPVAIIVPCHRVVASDGRLTGYSGGLDRKATLLRIEGLEVGGTKRSSRVRPEVLRLPL